MFMAAHEYRVRPPPKKKKTMEKCKTFKKTVSLVTKDILCIIAISFEMCECIAPLSIRSS